MALLRSVYASLIVSGCCITAAGLSSPSVAGEMDSNLDLAGAVPGPLAHPLLLGLTSGTCLGLMARLNAAKRQLHSLQVERMTDETAWSPMLQMPAAPEFAEADLNRMGLEKFLEASSDKPDEDAIIPTSIIAEYA